MSASVSTLQPPSNEQPVAPDGQHTQAWTAYHQEVANTVEGVTNTVAALSVTVAALPARMRRGVTDGTDAAAGDIGETIAPAPYGPVSLTTATETSIGSFVLPPGDWDVSATVFIEVSLSNAVALTASVSLNPTTWDVGGTHNGGAQITAPNLGNTRLVTAPRRLSSSLARTVYLLAAAYFPSGAAAGSGSIYARRKR